MKIKELFKKLEIAEAKSDKIDEAWENDLENEELEAEWTKSYNEVNKAFEALVNEIVRVTAIDPKTAGLMVRAKRNELKSLVERIA